jgi:hypothetical protein
MTSSDLFDRAEIAEVDQFGSDLEFLQHDGVQRWRLTFAPTHPFEEPHGEGEVKREVEEAHQRGENSWLVACCVFSSQGASLYRRMGAGLPLPQGKGATAKGGKT